MKKLYRSREEKMLGGVCGGIAEYFKIDPTLIRLAFVLFFFADGAGVLAYIIGWFIIPEKPNHLAENNQASEDHFSAETEIENKKTKYEKSEDRAKEENNKNVNDNENKDDSFSFKLKADSQNMWGILLILIGGAFLIRFWFPFGLIEKMWPLLIVFLGFAFLFKSKKK